MQIAVSERSNIRSALADRRIRPETVTENIALSQYRHYFIVLYNFKATGYDEAQRIDGFSGMIQQIARRAVRHREVHRQGAETSIRR
jgi:hypothetical protein